MGSRRDPCRPSHVSPLQPLLSGSHAPRHVSAAGGARLTRHGRFTLASGRRQRPPTSTCKPVRPQRSGSGGLALADAWSSLTTGGRVAVAGLDPGADPLVRGDDGRRPATVSPRCPDRAQGSPKAMAPAPELEGPSWRRQPDHRLRRASHGRAIAQGGAIKRAPAAMWWSGWHDRVTLKEGGGSRAMTRSAVCELLAASYLLSSRIASTLQGFTAMAECVLNVPVCGC